MVAAVKLAVNVKATALQMAQNIFGEGTSVTGASYTGDKNSSGIWSNGDTVAPNLTPGNSGVILSTGKAADITNSSGSANHNTNTTTDTSGPNNNALFNAAAHANTYDASYLDVDFIPTHDLLTIRFVFASEEYPEYVGSIYNDIVGVWINGTFVNPLSDPTQIGTVNPITNPNLYVANTASQYNTEMDGFTVTMTMTIPVNAGQLNSIRIGIADVGDAQYDSNLLIGAGSVQTQLVAITDDATVDFDHAVTIAPLDNDVNHTGGTLTITEINGIAVSPGGSVTLTTGQVVTLNADGTLTILADDDEESVNFTYTIHSTSGDSDVGYITLHTVPCFVAGTMIATPGGERPVESLAPGDLVCTLDEGPQPLRWIGRRTVPASGDQAPIAISAGAFGDHGRLVVSPLHRILLRHGLAEMLFGAGEVLVAARDLVNDLTVRPMPGGWVDYVHILFDRHQIVTSNGMATESFLPGPQTADAYEAAMIAEICALFPEFDPATGCGYSAAARPTLKSYEARLFRAQAQAA